MEGDVGEGAQASSTYCTMTSDSETGLPPWMRTGIFSCTGLDLSRRSLLLERSSSVYS
jgi:hypothetical protein